MVHGTGCDRPSSACLLLSLQSAERVVNQLLTEMDGMDGRQGVFIVAATNRQGPTALFAQMQSTHAKACLVPRALQPWQVSSRALLAHMLEQWCNCHDCASLPSTCLG